jgi:hypothetical protein
MGARKYPIYFEYWTWYLKSERSELEWDIMFNTRNKSGYFQAPMYFSVYYIKDSLWKAIIFTEKR